MTPLEYENRWFIKKLLLKSRFLLDHLSHRWSLLVTLFFIKVQVEKREESLWARSKGILEPGFRLNLPATMRLCIFVLVIKAKEGM